VLQLLPGLTSLHLQHNKLQCIQALASLPNRRLLCAAHNQIPQVRAQPMAGPACGRMHVRRRPISAERTIAGMRGATRPAQLDEA
jgi:hypothetical protein